MRFFSPDSNSLSIVQLPLRIGGRPCARRDGDGAEDCANMARAVPKHAVDKQGMTSNDVSFHHPIAFWLGCALLVAGVLSHAPMFLMGAHLHYRLVGMPMDATMLAGMALI